MLHDLPPIYEWHPMVVHFPIALLLTGAFFKVLSTLSKNKSFDLIQFWLLRLGCLAAIVAAVLGYVASRTAPHVPPAWETLWDHKWLGISTAVVSVLLWMVESLAHRKPAAWSRWLAGLLWIAVVILLVATGSEGAELVYTYGLAVAPAPHL